MTITESKLKEGVISLGTNPAELDFSCQVTNARINSAYEAHGDAVETLCGESTGVGRKLSGRSLAGTFIQDWDAAAAESITKYCFAHDLEVLAFSYQPNVTADTITGMLTVEVPGETWGGDVNSRLTSDFEWQISGELTFTPPAAAAASARQKVDA